MSKEIKKITGIINRIGPLNGASIVDIQFMLENNKEVYIVFAGKNIGLSKVGDEVNFNLGKTFLQHHNVDQKSFVNLTLNAEL